MARRRICVVVMSHVMLTAIGCATRAPVLLYRSSDVTGSTTLMPVAGAEEATARRALLPLKAGIRVAAAQSRKATSLSTFFFPFLFVSAGFPKRDEMEFLRDSIARDLYDTGTFRYTYPAPFNPATVDVVIDVAVTNVRASNLKGWSTIVNLPMINLVQLIGVPQEIFFARMGFRFDVKARDGTLIKSYAVANRGMRMVTIYGSPWASYMWYRSVFREKFLASMDQFREQLVADAPLILQRVGSGK